MTFDHIADFMSRLGSSLKSIAKMLVQSRRSNITRDASSGGSIIVMGNGPSLADSIREHSAALKNHPTIAVNFAACAPEFMDLKPPYYVLADPLFFSDSQAENLLKLRRTLSQAVHWPMTIFVPAKQRKRFQSIIQDNPDITIETFNPVGVEGFGWLENFAYRHNLGMPRPRNVLIPSIMIAIALGYKDVYIAGADHSWLKSISVNERNEVVSIQPHFYKDGEEESQRVRTEYMHYPLHQILMSFYVAFRAYHRIQRYATWRGIAVYNSTPGSFIDAFPRRQLP